jgi:hypothetical protein
MLCNPNNWKFWVLSSGIWRRLFWWNSTNVSGYHIASTFRIEEKERQDASMKRTAIATAVRISNATVLKVLSYKNKLDEKNVLLRNSVCFVNYRSNANVFFLPELPSPFIINAIRNAFFLLLWLYSPNLGLGLPPWNSPSHFGLIDLGHSVGLLGRVISTSQGLYLYTNTGKHTHTHTNIHALSGIRTHDPGFWTSEDSACLRPLGYRDLST